MKIIFFTTMQASLDGRSVTQVEAGVEYETAATDVGSRLALAHIERGHAATPDDYAEHLRAIEEAEKVDSSTPVAEAAVNPQVNPKRRK